MSRYYVFSRDEIGQIKKLYKDLPLNEDGTVSKEALLFSMPHSADGELLTEDDVKLITADLTPRVQESFDFTEFLQLLSRVKASDPPPQEEATAPAPTPTPRNSKSIHELTSITGATHSFSDEERNMLASHINKMPQITSDPEVASLLPIEPDRLFEKIGDGILLCKLVNAIKPGTIDKRKIGTAEGNKKNAFKIVETLVAGIQGASAAGLTVVNVGAEDFLEKRAHLILGVIWQIVKADLLSKVALTHHPELCHLVQGDESLSQLLYIPPEQVLVRWFNYHLQKAGRQRTVSNFTTDLKDCENYIALLSQIAPNVCSLDLLSDTDPTIRAEKFVACVKELDASLYIAPHNITSGNGRMNLAFVAELFNLHSGMELPTEQEAEKLRQDNAMLSKRLQEMEEQLKRMQIEKDRKQFNMNFILERNAEKPKGLFERVGKTIDSGLTEIDQKYKIKDKSKKVKKDITHTTQDLVEKAKKITSPEPEAKEDKKAKLEEKLAKLKEHNKKMDDERKERLDNLKK